MLFVRVDARATMTRDPSAGIVLVHNHPGADELLNRSPSVHAFDVPEAPHSPLHAVTGLTPIAIHLHTAIITIGEETDMKAQEVAPIQCLVRVGHETET